MEAIVMVLISLKAINNTSSYLQECCCCYLHWFQEHRRHSFNQSKTKTHSRV